MLTLLDFEFRKQSRKDIAQALAVTTGSPYASGNVLGGLITLKDLPTTVGPIPEAGLSTVLRSLLVADSDNQKVGINLHFFNAQPTAVVDKTAWAPTAADLKALIAVVPIVTGDYVTIAGTTLAYANGANQNGLNRILKPASGTSLWCVPQVLGTPTWTSGIQIRFQFGEAL